MAALDVQGGFLITIGHGEGPEAEVVISVADPDGRPVMLDFDQDPVEIFIALSAMFGASSIPLRIVDTHPMPLGFYGLRVRAPDDLGVEVHETVPASLGVIVEVQQDRGQAVICSCAGAGVTSWFGKEVQERPNV